LDVIVIPVGVPCPVAPALGVTIDGVDTNGEPLGVFTVQVSLIEGAPIVATIPYAVEIAPPVVPCSCTDSPGLTTLAAEEKPPVPTCEAIGLRGSVLVPAIVKLTGTVKPEGVTTLDVSKVVREPGSTSLKTKLSGSTARVTVIV
jgi:hypothetical protein